MVSYLGREDPREAMKPKLGKLELSMDKFNLIFGIAIVAISIGIAMFFDGALGTLGGMLGGVAMQISFRHIEITKKKVKVKPEP